MGVCKLGERIKLGDVAIVQGSWHPDVPDGTEARIVERKLDHLGGGYVVEVTVVWRDNPNAQTRRIWFEARTLHPR